jgi:hypothetical protein
MKLHAVFAAAALVAAGAAYAVYAQAPSSAPPAPSPDRAAAIQAIRTACAADFQTLCAGQEGRAAFMCLRTNQDKASPACKDALSKLPPPPPPPAG